MNRFLFLVLFLPALLQAHPFPDLPVHSFFSSGGKARIEVEVDPRLLDAEPDKAAYLVPEAFAAKSEEEKAALLKQASEYAAQRLRFRLEPLGEIKPEFQWSHLEKNADPGDTAAKYHVMHGKAEVTVPAGIAGYQVVVNAVGDRTVVLVHHINDTAQERIQRLFPGESGYVLDLTQLSGASATPVADAQSGSGGWGHVFWEYLRDGFLHVIPLGLDHLLFVLGLFLLSRQWKPVLLQVTSFTIAHTLTLGLATLGYVSVPAEIVEPVIAGSIVLVAVENLFKAKFTYWRLLIVFCFGLVHGLGFAGALADMELPASSLVVGLIGFNIGVEVAQLTAIAAAWLLTCWVQPEARYRRWVVIPGSVAIALAGTWWVYERVFS